MFRMLVCMASRASRSKCCSMMVESRELWIHIMPRQHLTFPCSRAALHLGDCGVLTVACTEV